jgi:hypothetical protein
MISTPPAFLGARWGEFVLFVVVFRIMELHGGSGDDFHDRYRRFAQWQCISFAVCSTLHVRERKDRAQQACGVVVTTVSKAQREMGKLPGTLCSIAQHVPVPKSMSINTLDTTASLVQQTSQRVASEADLASQKCTDFHPQYQTENC